MIGKCKLCGNRDELKASHIIPKFIYKWMKETGSGYIGMVPQNICSVKLVKKDLVNLKLIFLKQSSTPI